MKRVGLLLNFVWMAVGCGSPTLLTAPLCEPGQWDLPAEYEGDYTLLMEEANSEYSGTMLFTEQTVSIRRSAKGPLEVWLKQPHPLALTKVREVVPYAAICEISGNYYYQERQSAGFVVSKLNLGATFFDVAGLVFHPDTLKDAQIPFYLLPKLYAETLMRSDVNPFSFDLMSPLQIVVDNRDIEPSRLLEFGHPLSMTYSLHRVSPQKVYGSSWVRIR